MMMQEFAIHGCIFYLVHNLALMNFEQKNAKMDILPGKRTRMNVFKTLWLTFVFFLDFLPFTSEFDNDVK